MIKLTNRSLGPDACRNVTVACRTELVAAEHTQTELKATRWSFRSGYEKVLEVAGRMLLSRGATYRCDDTRGCVMQFWPPDDEGMCSKHVEAWNKTNCKTKFCTSSWLNTEINILRCTVSNTINILRCTVSKTINTLRYTVSKTSKHVFVFRLLHTYVVHCDII